MRYRVDQISEYVKWYERNRIYFNCFSYRWKRQINWTNNTWTSFARAKDKKIVRMYGQSYRDQDLMEFFEYYCKSLAAKPH